MPRKRLGDESVSDDRLEITIEALGRLLGGGGGSTGGGAAARGGGACLLSAGRGPAAPPPRRTSPPGPALGGCLPISYKCGFRSSIASETSFARRTRSCIPWCNWGTFGLMT